MFLLHLLFYLYTTRLSINPFHHHYNKYNKFKIFIFIILSSISCSLSLSCYSLQIRIWFGFCFLSKRLFICCVFHHPFLFLSWSVYALNMIINFNYLNYLLYVTKIGNLFHVCFLHSLILLVFRHLAFILCILLRVSFFVTRHTPLFALTFIFSILLSLWIWMLDEQLRRTRLIHITKESGRKWCRLILLWATCYAGRE